LAWPLHQQLQDAQEGQQALHNQLTAAANDSASEQARLDSLRQQQQQQQAAAAAACRCAQ
jgi:hypothetical protein